MEAYDGQIICVTESVNFIWAICIWNFGGRSLKHFKKYSQYVSSELQMRADHRMFSSSVLVGLHSTIEKFSGLAPVLLLKTAKRPDISGSGIDQNEIFLCFLDNVCRYTIVSNENVSGTHSFLCLHFGIDCFFRTQIYLFADMQCTTGLVVFRSRSIW